MIPSELELLLRIAIAALIGIILGIEREYVGKPAGMRTYSLVAIGATIFTIISKYGFLDIGGAAVDTSRVAAQIVTGIGFLGAGVIIFRGAKVEGLTTASGLWVVAAIGMAIGVGMYMVAIASTVVVFIVMVVMRRFDIEHWRRRK